MSKRENAVPVTPPPSGNENSGGNSGNTSSSGGDSGNSSSMFENALSGGSSFRDSVSMPIGGGTLSPAKVGKGYGFKWSAKFDKGGKVSSASKRGDGIAQRGKTKGRYL